MAERTQRVALIAVLINLTFIAVIGYALDLCRQPAGVLFVTAGGPAAFAHKKHVQHGGDTLQCRSCHHDIKGKPNTAMNCRGCHYHGDKPQRNEKAKTHKRCIGVKCVSCHADKQCGHCHRQ